MDGEAAQARLESGEAEEADAAPTAAPNMGVDWAMVFGIVLTVIGVILMLIGYAKEGAPAYSDMLNIGLLNDKSNLVAIGGTLTLAGVLFMCTAILAGRIRKALSDRSE